MNLPIDRPFVSQFVIAIGVCVGSWLMLVRPQLKEISALNAEIAGHAGGTPAMTRDTVRGIADRANQMRARIADIEARNALAGDSPRLYGMVMNIAAQTGVQIQSMQPGVAQQKSGKEQFTSARLEMLVEGSYQQVSDFVSELTSLPAFMRAEALELAPTLVDGQQLVTARIICNALRFSIPEELVKFGAAAHAQP